MIQLCPGDLVAVRKDGSHFLFAILSKQILFGGHWSFVFHGSGPELLQQQPAKGEVNYRIWRWKDGQRADADYVRFDVGCLTVR